MELIPRRGAAPTSYKDMCAAIRLYIRIYIYISAISIPFLLAQAPVVKLPYASEFSSEYYADCNSMYLECSMKHSQRTIEELERIRELEIEKWEQLRSTRELTDQDWEYIHSMAQTRIQHLPSIPTNYPAELKFLLPPDPKKRQNFIGPNPALRAIYTTSGQRPPRQVLQPLEDTGNRSRPEHESNNHSNGNSRRNNNR